MLTQEHLALRLYRLWPGERWSCDPPGLVFMFPHSGSGRLTAGPITRDLHSGDVLLCESSLTSQIAATDGAEIVFWSFTLQVEHLFPLFASHELTLLQSIASELKSPRLYPNAHPIAVECHRLLVEIPPCFSLDHRGQLLRIAATVLAVEFKREHSVHAGFVGVEEHMAQVLEKLTFDEILGLSVDDLAGKFGCSRRHLNRLFHHYFGLSVAALRMEMRLLKAVSLLRDPGSKVIFVAEKCGFNHLGLFNTCFKRRFGVSPGQWRKSRSEEATPADGFAPHAGCRLQSIGLCPWCAKFGNALPDSASMPQATQAHNGGKPAGTASSHGRNLAGPPGHVLVPSANRAAAP